MDTSLSKDRGQMANIYIYGKMFSILNEGNANLRYIESPSYPGQKGCH